MATEPIEAVVEVPLSAIDFSDETYRFRADLRVGPLATSIKRDGQQVPALLIRRPDGQHVIVCGFRRCHGAKQAKVGFVRAVVRHAMDDAAAFRASLLENSQRRTYSDVDRALAVRAAKQRRLASDEWSALLGVRKLQAERIEQLLDLPPEVQASVDDDADAFTLTHALALARLKRRYPDLVWRDWIDRVNEARLTALELTKEVNARLGADESQSLKSIFHPTETDEDARVFRLQPVVIDVAKLSEVEVARLRRELLWLLKALPGDP